MQSTTPQKNDKKSLNLANDYDMLRVGKIAAQPSSGNANLTIGVGLCLFTSPIQRYARTLLSSTYEMQIL